VAIPFPRYFWYTQVSVAAMITRPPLSCVAKKCFCSGRDRRKAIRRAGRFLGSDLAQGASRGDNAPDQRRKKGRTPVLPRRQSLLTNLFASTVITTGTLVPSGSVSDMKIARAWFPLLS
jgi:hypothetical protein